MTTNEIIFALPAEKRVELTILLLALELARAGHEPQKVACELVALAASYPHKSSVDRLLFTCKQLRCLRSGDFVESNALASALYKMLGGVEKETVNRK